MPADLNEELQGGDSVQDCCIRIGGEAGQGLRSVGSLLSKALHAQGYHIFSNQDYESRVRGGHNFYNIRFSQEPLFAHTDRVDILVALDSETTKVHMEDLGPEGIAVYDPDIKGIECPDETRCFAVPFQALGEKHGSKIMANTAAAATIWGLLGADFDILEHLLRQVFSDKDERVIESNVFVASEAYSNAAGNWEVKLRIPKPPSDKRSHLLISGNSCIAVGAIAAGLKFMSAYPMSPSTSITEYVATQSREFNIVMEQAEDEIAAVVMAIGASYAGVRSMVATSGGGMALMAEAVSMAGMNETAVVIIDAQRPGPATGLPTRTAQEDLFFAINLGHGEFPKIVLAPGTHDEAFELTAKAFNLADRFQCPVIVLTDQHLADAQRTIPPFDFPSVMIDRGLLVSTDDAAGYPEYKRYEVTESGVSRRFIPGFGRSLVVSCTDEHDEEGHLTEVKQIRSRQTEKRMRKLEVARSEMPGPTVYGDEGAENALICWGSTYGAAREAVDQLTREGRSFKLLHFSHLWPINPDSVRPALDSAKQLVCVEHNYTGQLARLLQSEVGVRCSQIRRYDGRPISPNYILDHLGKEER